MTVVSAGMAWQRQMRETIAQEERDSDTGEYWKEYDLDIASAEVKPIGVKDARAVIEQYEWLGKMPAVAQFCFGIFFGEALAGVAVYGPEYGENLGIWDKYGYTGKIILLARGACTHWAHPHSASKLIRGSMRMLPPRYEVVTATVDTRAGEVGTIYQACGFDYVGPLRPKGDTTAIVNGKLYTQRNLQIVFGTKSIRKLQQRFGDDAIVIVRDPPKARYFAFRGGKIARKHNRRAIAHMIKPYPRRDADAQPAQLFQGRQDFVRAA
jgi:hypothetical protein